MEDEVRQPMSPVLRRLIEEVKQDQLDAANPVNYNRTHNRHNRSSSRPWSYPDPDPDPEPKPEPEPTPEPKPEDKENQT